MGKTKVLHLFNKMDMGGAETLVVNIYRKLSTDNIQFDFAVSNSDGGYYDNEIKKMGGKIHVITHPADNIFKYMFDLKRVINQGNYEIIHSHVHFFSGINMLIAKLCGVRIRISHSHTYTIGNRSRFRKNYELIMKFLINSFSTNKLACSQEAGKDLFFKNDYKVINNGIDLNKFIKKNHTEIYKKKLNIPKNSFVVGHVGAFRNEKNHLKIISIFIEILKTKPESILLLVGEGDQKEKILEIVKKNKIESKVIFTGNLSEVEMALFAMDVFVFPSLYEGLGIAVIEAQACGLYCVVSNKVPKETDLTGNIKFLDLDESSEIWKNEIIKGEDMKLNDINKINNYDIHKTCEEVKKVYKNSR